MSRRAVILFAHGSPVETANQAVRELAGRVAGESGWRVEAAFLDGGEPVLEDCAAALIGEGFSHLVVAPYFLTMGLHLRRDLPELARRIRARFPEVRLDLGAPLEGHPALAAILLDRAASAGEGES